MIWVDVAILIIIGISAAISLVRGFVKEALSLLGWVAAIGAALYFSESVATLLDGHIETPSLRVIVAFVGIFLLTLLTTAVLNMFVVKLVKLTGLSGTDRMVGVVFGVIRGCVVVAVLVMLAGLTAVPQDSWWGESIFLGYFEQLALWGKQFLPTEVANALRY
jgi:membrane protein required for colicin V production